jgi:hypothetical protein
VEARRSIEGKNWTAAALMARSAIQLIARYHKAQGKNLKEEIDDLAAKSLILPVMTLSIVTAAPCQTIPETPERTPRYAGRPHRSKPCASGTLLSDGFIGFLPPAPFFAFARFGLALAKDVLCFNVATIRFAALPRAAWSSCAPYRALPIFVSVLSVAFPFEP